MSGKSVINPLSIDPNPPSVRIRFRNDDGSKNTSEESPQHYHEEKQNHSRLSSNSPRVGAAISPQKLHWVDPDRAEDNVVLEDIERRNKE